jgi:ATP-dependent DNA ligase
MRIDGGEAALLTRSSLDWSHRYHRTIEALGSLKVKSAYLDGELCALNSQGVPVLSRPQAAMAEHARPDFVYSRRSYVKTATTSLPSGALRGADVQVSTLPLICMV